MSAITALTEFPFYSSVWQEGSHSMEETGMKIQPLTLLSP